jgi:hypothetical protein
MTYLVVQDRFQIQMRSMEEFIDKENAVRFIDAFVEQLGKLPQKPLNLLKTHKNPKCRLASLLSTFCV